MHHRVFTIAAALLFATLVQTSATAQLSRLFGSRPAVAEISAAELRALQTTQAKAGTEAGQAAANDQPPTPDFIVVDVRTPAEVAVSVLPGAITAKAFEQNRQLYRGRLVIPYCTSGYRSGKYAEKLAADGVDVKNFKGSILGWCAAKLPLETLDRKPTNRVHTYSSRNKVPSEYKAVW